MPKLVLRCSALPLAFKCAGSVRPGAVPINESNDAADVGTAGHEGLAEMVKTGRVDWEAVPALAKKHDVDEAELRVLLALGAQLWHDVRESFPGAETEVAMQAEIGDAVLTGHADLIGRSALTAHVGDWKLGRLDSNYREQLIGYAVLALLTHPELTAATAGVLWVREHEYEHYALSRPGLDEWRKRFTAEIVNWDGVFRPGSHCQYCPRSHECPAANALARRDLAIIADQDLPGQLEDRETIAELVRRDPDRAVALVEKARALTKQADRVIEAIKAEVLRSGDVEGEAKRLTLQRTEKRHLDVLQTFPVLEDLEFDDNERAEVISISVSKAESVVAKRAGKGSGAQAVRDFNAKLAKAGAISTSTSVSLVVRRQA
jgi:hypothetical protein